MPFVITAINLAGAVSLKRDDDAAAMKKALELVGEGYRDVRIADEQGQEYTVADFHSLIQSTK